MSEEFVQLVCPLGKCDGAGKISYVHREHEDIQRELGGGLVAGPLTTYGSRLCACRESLEPREGEAQWWTSERVFHGHAQASIYEEGFEVQVDAEVPISEDNYKLVRRGNRYYPTLIDFYVDFRDKTTLFPEEARALAKVLANAADAADAIDLPCADSCGHWFPCDCVSRGGKKR